MINNLHLNRNYVSLLYRYQLKLVAYTPKYEHYLFFDAINKFP